MADMRIQSIRDQLARATAALETGNLDEAQDLYKQVYDVAASVDLDLFDQALDGLDMIEQRRNSAAHQGSGPPQPSTEATKPQTEPPAPNQTFVLLPPEQQAPDARSDDDETSQQSLAEPPTVQYDSDYSDRLHTATPAMSDQPAEDTSATQPPDEQVTESVMPEPQPIRPRAAETQRLSMDELGDPQLPDQPSPDQPPPDQPPPDQFDPIDLDLWQPDTSMSNGRVDVNTTPPTTPPDSDSDAELQSLDTQTRRRIDELEAEAKQYLEQPTNQNYKHARDRFDLILGLLPANAPQEQRENYRLRREQIERDRRHERFNAANTAAQLGKIVDELVEIRKLQVDGERFDDKGESLEIRFANRLDILSQTILRSTTGHFASVETARDDGLDLLSPGLFTTTAMSKLDEVAALLNGDGVRLGKASPVELPQDSPDELSPENDSAVRYIKERLQEKREIQDARKDLQQWRTEISRLARRVETAQPIYTAAYALYERQDYKQAVAKAQESHLMLSNNGRDTDVNSEQIERLLLMANNRWERSVRAQAESLLDQTRSAMSRGNDTEAEQLCHEIKRFEPDLETPVIQAIRQKADDLLQEIYQKRQAIIEQQRAAEEQARTHERTTHERIRQSLSQAQAALASDSLEELNTAKQHVERQRDELNSISNAQRQRTLRQAIDDALFRMDERLQEVRASQQILDEAQRLLDQAELARDNNRFEDAHRDAEAARQLLRDFPSDLPIRASCDEMAHSILFDWDRALRQDIRRLLQSGTLDPHAAQRQITKLREIGTHDDAELQQWEQKARHEVLRKDGLAAYDRGDLEAAIAQLMQVSTLDEDMLRALHDARYRIGLRYIDANAWQQAVKILEQGNLRDHETQQALGHARFGWALEQAAEARRTVQLEQAATALARAQSLLRPELGLEPQFEAEQKRLDQANQAVRLTTVARQLHHEYETKGQLDYLRNALERLSEAIGLLPESEQQHTETVQLRQSYINGARQTCLHAIESGKRAFSAQDYRTALGAFRQAEALYVSDQQQTIEEWITRTRQVIKKNRRDIITQMNELLRSQSVTSARLQALQEQLNDARTWDEQEDDGLTQAEQDIAAALIMIARVEEQLSVVQQEWIRARSQTGNFQRPQELITTASRILEAVPYNHAYLHPGGSDSLALRITEDYKHYQDAINYQKQLLDTLDDSDNQTQWRQLVQQLQEAETHMLAETKRVAKDLKEAAPVAARDCYPLQSQFLEGLVTRVNRLVRQLQEDEHAGTNELDQYYALVDLFDTINGEDRFDMNRQLQRM